MGGTRGRFRAPLARPRPSQCRKPQFVRLPSIRLSMSVLSLPHRLLAGAALLLALIAAPALAAAADVEAVLSAAQVDPGQPVVLTLSAAEPLPAGVDLAPLQQDFRILDRASRKDVRVVNGVRSERHELRIGLQPLRTGTLAVPALRVGDVVTAPLSLEVAEAPAAAPAPADVASAAAPVLAATDAGPAIRMRAEPRRVLVDQQLLLVMRVTADAPPRGRLEDPVIDGARVLPLGEERRVESTASGSRHVYERRLAVFPEARGTLEIPAARFTFRGPGAEEQTLTSNDMRIPVGPRPAGIATRRPWLPAKSVRLSEAGPSQVRIAPGQTLERMVTLRAEGVMAEDLPKIPLRIPQHLRLREDAPRLWNERTARGVVGYRTERVEISSNDEGEYTIAAGPLNWWSTTDEAWRRTRLPDWTLTVAPFLSADRRLPARWEPAQVPGGATGDTRDGDSAGPEPEPEGGSDVGPNWTLWGIGIIAVLLLLPALLLLLRRRPIEPPDQAYRPPQAPPATADSEADPVMDAIGAVERAYRSGNAAAARSALLDWAALQWPVNKPTNLSQLALRVSDGLQGDIRLLEKAFFSPSPIDWRRDIRPALEHESAAAADAPADAAP